MSTNNNQTKTNNKPMLKMVKGKTLKDTRLIPKEVFDYAYRIYSQFPLR